MTLLRPLSGLERAARALKLQGRALDNAREAVDRDRVSARHRQDLEGLPDLGRSAQLAGMSEGLVLTDEEQARVHDVRPAEGFAEVAGDALQLLQQRHGLDLWMVTRVRDGSQSVVVARGVVGMPVPADAVQPWAESYCRLMVAGGAPRVAPRAADVPAYASSRATARFGIAAYIGVPLLAADGTLFGTLCALSATEQPESLRDALPEVELVARLLSTVLAKETAALERSYEAAQAYARADRDLLTGLLNPRGWQARLLVEEERCRRHGRTASVLAVDLDDLRRVNIELGAGSGDHLLKTAAEVLQRGCRSIDVVARTGGDEFGVLLVESGRVEARALAARLQRALVTEGVQASTAVGVRGDDLDLRGAWQDAARQVGALTG